VRKPVLDELLKLVQIANQAIQVLALLVGASWAYFKFIRGRTFTRRAEAGVEGALLTLGQDLVIKAKVSLQNTGLSRLPLSAEEKVVRVYGSPRSQWSTKRNLAWEQDPLVLAPVLKDHSWVEAQESVSDEVLIPVPSGDWVAFKIQVLIVGAPPRQTSWVSNAILPAEINPVVVAR
jgi:hypothetical protein